MDFAAAAPWQYGYIFLSGALAITAIVLPGVSGSTLLLIMGVYLPTVQGMRSLFHLDFSPLPGLIALGLGILLRAVVAVHFVRTALQKYRSQTLWLVVGLRLGSLAAIVMGPTTLPEPQAALSYQSFELMGFLLGICILVGLEYLKKLTVRA